MRHSFTLLKNEVRMLVSSPTMYIVSAAFILLVTAIYSYLLVEFGQNEQSMSFTVAFFQCAWLPIILFVPLITMRAFSEDYKNGMLKNTLTTRATIGDVVMSKMMAIFLYFAAILMSIALVFYITKASLPELAHDVSFSNKFEITGGLIFLGLLGFFYLSIGIMCSSLTENQVVAGMLTFGALFVQLIFSQYFSSNSINVNFKDVLSFSDLISPIYHIENFCNGIIDSRPIAFYMSFSIALLFITKYIIQNKVK